MSQTAIVTGASSGIGATIAVRLGAAGCNVIVNYNSDAAGAAEVVTKVIDAGGGAEAVSADAGDSAAAKRLFDAADAEFGGVDILVNNAERAARKPIAEFSDEDFEVVMRPNLSGAFFCLREATRRLRDGGRIVNISMSHQGAPIPGYGAYAASKAALEELTRVAARELGPRRITVNALRPGPTRTPLFLAGKSPEVLTQFENQIALGRLGKPEDAAHVVAFLVSEEGGWITGQSFAANGGYW